MSNSKEKSASLWTKSGRAQRRANKQLIRAVYSGYLDTIKSALAQGADINATSSNDYSYKSAPLLSVAIYHGQPLSAELLVARGADINKTDSRGKTPLMYAIKRKDERVIRLLLAKGADKEALTNAGVSTMDIARTEGGTRVVALLEGRELQQKDAPEARAAPLSVDVDLGGETLDGDETEIDSGAVAELPQQEILLERQIDDIVLQELFDFTTRERLTFVRVGEEGDVQSFTRESFDDIRPRSVLQAAFNVYRKRGGTMSAEEVFAVDADIEKPKPQLPSKVVPPAP